MRVRVPLLAVMAGFTSAALVLGGCAHTNAKRIEVAQSYTPEFLSFSADSRFVVTSNMFTVRTWNPVTGSLVRDVGGFWVVNSRQRIPPGGQYFVAQTVPESETERRVFHLRRMESGDEVGLSLGNESGAGYVFSQSSAFVAEWSNWSGNITLWDINRRKLAWQVQLTCRDPRWERPPLSQADFDAIVGCAFSHDARKMAAYGSPGNVHILDGNSGVESLCYRGHAAVVRGAAFALDDSVVVSGDGQGNIRVWNPDDGLDFAEWRAHTGSIGSRLLESCPHGRLIASAGIDGERADGKHHEDVWSVKLWSVSSRTMLEYYAAQGRPVVLAFSLDCRKLAIGDSFGRISIVDLPGGHCGTGK